MKYELKEIDNYAKKIFFIFLILLVGVICLFLLFFILPRLQDKALIKCDGNLESLECAKFKPFFCENGVLIEKASVCECEEGYVLQGDFCFNILNTDEKENSFNYFFNEEYSHFNLILYKGIYNYLESLPRSISYFGNTSPNRKDFVMLKIENEIQLEAIKSLVVQIQNMAPNDKVNQLRIAISLVQNIPYAEPKETINFAGTSVSKSRFPYQVLYDNEGSCEEKSELLILLLGELDYEVAAFYYGPENHESVGIKCPIKSSLDNSGYCFVESTAPSILGDNGGDYLGTGRLLSNPEIIPIHQGISLPANLKEYSDSKKIMKLRDGKFVLVFSKSKFLANIDKRYGIIFN